MEAQSMLILSGRYIGFLPCHVAEQYVREGKMRAIKSRQYAFSSQHSVAFRQTDRGVPLVKAFLDAYRRRPAAKRNR